jgi:hypothetical protein
VAGIVGEAGDDAGVFALARGHAAEGGSQSA